MPTFIEIGQTSLEIGVGRKKIPHPDTHTHPRHPDWLSRASQHARGATKNWTLSRKKAARIIYEVLTDTWRNNKACSARGPSAVGGPKFARRCFLKVFLGKRGPFWNTCTRAHCNLVTPLTDTHAKTLLILLLLDSLSNRREDHFVRLINSFISGKCHAAVTSFVTSLPDKSLDIESSRTNLGRRKTWSGWHFAVQPPTWYQFRHRDL